MDTAQVVDTFFGHWVPHGSSAVNFQWIDNKVDVRWINWDYSVCSEELLISGECVPFFDSEGGILLTIGYVVTVLVFLPMALMDLKVSVSYDGFIIEHLEQIYHTCSTYRSSMKCSSFFIFRKMPLCK